MLTELLSMRSMAESINLLDSFYIRIRMHINSCCVLAQVKILLQWLKTIRCNALAIKASKSRIQRVRRLICMHVCHITFDLTEHGCMHKIW